MESAIARIRDEIRRLNVYHIIVFLVGIAVGSFYAGLSYGFNWIMAGSLVVSVTFLAYLGLYERGYNRVKNAIVSEEKYLNCYGRNLQRFWSNNREQSMITMGSLFVPTSFLLLGAASQTSVTSADRFALSLLAPALYGVWLFTIQLSTRLMNDTDAKLQQLAHGPGGEFARLQGRLYGDRYGKGWIMVARRNHWLLYLPILIYGSSYLILH